MTSRNDAKCVKDTFRLAASRQKAAGKRIRKLSGKPFADGDKVAVVVGVVSHPVTGRPAFKLLGMDDVVEAGQCYLAKDHWRVEQEHRRRNPPRVEYFFVPTDRFVPMEKAPARIWSVCPWRGFDYRTGAPIENDPFDPTKKPTFPQDQNPTAMVQMPMAFAEDVCHDWQWWPARGSKPAGITYASRAFDHSVWIRCEFED